MRSFFNPKNYIAVFLANNRNIIQGGLALSKSPNILADFGIFLYFLYSIRIIFFGKFPYARGESFSIQVFWATFWANFLHNFCVIFTFLVSVCTRYTVHKHLNSKRLLADWWSPIARDLMDSQDPKDLLFCYDLRVFREKYFQPLAVIHKDIHITAIELLEDFFSQQIQISYQCLSKICVPFLSNIGIIGEQTFIKSMFRGLSCSPSIQLCKVC